MSVAVLPFDNAPVAGDLPRLIVFDAGGVVIRLASFWDGVLARTGLVLTVDAADASFQAAHAVTSRAHQLGHIALEAYVERVATATGLDPAQVRAILDAHLIEEFEGVGGVVDRLEAAGIESALLSNTNAYHWALMFPRAGEPIQFPTPARFGHQFGSHRLGVMKPDPEIYRLVERMTRWRGGEILFFDDLEANVAGARGAGWRAELIDPEADPARQIHAVLDAAGVPQA